MSRWNKLIQSDDGKIYLIDVDNEPEFRTWLQTGGPVPSFAEELSSLDDIQFATVRLDPWSSDPYKGMEP